jgi:hypothetical protein
MDMQLSYLLMHAKGDKPIRGTLERLCEITGLLAGEWEICIANESEANVAYLRKDFPNTRIVHGNGIAACAGKYVIPLVDDVFPAGGFTIASIIAHLDENNQVGAVVGKFEGQNFVPALPTLVKMGVSGFRKSLLEKVGGFSSVHGEAADYDMTFRILGAGSRIEHRDDILFRPQTDIAPEEASAEEIKTSPRELTDRLSTLRRYLPDNVSQIYLDDWTTKYKALAIDGSGRFSVDLAMLHARLRSVGMKISSPDPVSSDVFESIFTLRQNAAMIGDWARRGSVWRVILADFSDNLWATYNACRSSGLQMRCIADNHPAYAGVHYRDLPIVPANRAFEGGGIDGVILTSTDPARIEANFKSIRHHFHGPILRLGQGARVATHTQAAAA